MKKVNIALIDSGLNIEKLSHKCSVEYVYSCDHDNYKDETGHGTNIVQTILSHEKKVKIYIFKIFSSNLICDIEKLLLVLDKILQDYPFIDIVNMSLGTQTDNQMLWEYCKKLNDRGVKLIAAYNNYSKSRSFPAEYSFVYGVKASMYFNCFEYSMSNKRNVTTYGFLPYYLVETSRITCLANSYAAAHFTGILSKELIEKKRSKQIEEKQFGNYIKQFGDFSWMKRIIIIDERMKINSLEYKKKNVELVGVCNINSRKVYDIFYTEKESLNYDTLVVDNYYSEHKETVLNYIIFNIKNGKNVFCVTGFGRKINSFLYMISRKSKCIFFIKYIW